MKVATLNATPSRFRSAAIHGGPALPCTKTAINGGATDVPAYGGWLCNFHNGDATSLGVETVGPLQIRDDRAGGGNLRGWVGGTLGFEAVGVATSVARYFPVGLEYDGGLDDLIH